MDKIQIATYNVRGLGEENKRAEIFHYIRKKKFDIIFMQECHNVDKIQKWWSSQWGNKIWFSHGSSNLKGVAILFSKKVSDKIQIHNTIQDLDGRYVILYLTLKGFKLVLANIYGPNSDEPLFYQKVFTNIARFSLHYVVIGGDLNVTIDPNIDKQGKHKTNELASKWIFDRIRNAN